ncbi:MAG TPA: SRPBCC family protein [Solirubrobacteraceae bacterium]|nr:SRPBCC family protein [Solirubrobacteraceae bacterium]
MKTVTSSGTATVTTPTDEQILITRDFDAPRRLVYMAWTAPELVRRWWSGHRGAMTIVEIDLRVGGMWRYVMEATGGFEVAFHGHYRELVPNERIVTTEVYEAMPDGEPALDTVTFTEADGRTTVELLMQLPSKEVRDMVLASGMEVGMQEQMDLLEQIAISLQEPS